MKVYPNTSRKPRELKKFVLHMVQVLSISTLLATSTAWAADVTPNVTKVSVIPPNPVAAAAGSMQVIVELSAPAVAGDTITFTYGGTAVAGTDYTDPTAGAFTITAVAGTGQTLAITTLAGSAAGDTFSVTSNAIASNTATFTAAASGGVATASSGTIFIQDSGINIADGETQPKLIGETNAGGTPVTKTLTIKNDGTAPLVISPLAPATTGITCTAGGTVKPEFTIVDPDTTASPDVAATIFTVPAGTSVDFQVQFAPPAGTPAGNYDCVLSVTSSATNIGGIGVVPPVSYDFAVRGIVTAAPPAGLPEIDVWDGTTELVDNTTTAIDLGTVESGGAPIQKTFAITNPGTGDLSVTSLVFSPDIPYFTRIDPYPSKVLAGATTDTFLIEFDPTSAPPGVYTAQVVIDSTDSAFQEGVENPFNFPVTITVTGTPAAGADIQVWETAEGTVEVLDGVAGTAFPATFSGTPVSRDFVIKNIGDSDLDLNSLNIEQTSGAFTWAPVSNPFPDLLAPLSTATFTVTFNPAAIGTYSGTVKIFNNALATNENPFDILLSGTAMSAEKEIQVLDGTTDIVKGGNVTFTTAPGGVVGTPVTKTFTIQNIGGTQLKLDSINFSTGGTGFKLGNFAATTLDPASGAKDKITFDVTMDAATAGEFTGTISIANDDTDENPFTFNISGTILSSLTTPEVMVWEVLKDGTMKEIKDEQTEIIDFSAAINTSVSKVFKVKNIGGVVLDLTALSPLPKGFSLVGEFPTEVLPGQTVQFEVKLNTTTVGSYGGTAEFFSTDVDENPFSFPIGASVAVPSPEVDVLDGTTSVASGTTVPVEFGPTGMGTSVSKIFTVKNTGDADLNLTTPATLTGTGFTINSFNPGPVKKGEFTTFTVTLSASAAGTYEGKVSFSNDDKDEGTYTFPVKGTVNNTPPVTEEIEVWDGNAQEITAGTAVPIPDGSTSIIEFGNTPVGTPAVQTFTVKNLGSEVLTLYSLKLPVGFTLQPGVTLSTVAPSNQISFDILMDAAAEGVYEGKLELFNSDNDETPYDFPLHGVVGTLAPVNLTVTTTGNGSVSQNPAGTACGSGCSTHSKGTSVTLTATPAAGGTFTSWGGDCSGTTNPLTLTMDAAKNCTATFSGASQTINLTVSKTGNGVVTSSDNKIKCGTNAADCVVDYTQGASVTLTATPDVGSIFKDWTGDCTGTTSPTTVTMDAAKSCTANFAVPVVKEILTVTKPSNGSIASDVGGISCGTTGSVCTAEFESGARVQLTATPDANFSFAGWSADCSPQATTNPANLTMTQNWTCSAKFDSTLPTTATLNFTAPSNGKITTQDGKIDCGTKCTASYNIGDVVIVEASSSSAAFDHWTGDCGTGTASPGTLNVTQELANNPNWTCSAVFKNITTAEGDCFETGQGILVNGNQCVGAPTLATTTSTGEATTAAIRGGISKFDGPYLQRNTVTLIDPVNTLGVIKVDPNDVGKPAEIVVIGRHDDVDMYPPVGMAWYMMVPYNSPLGWTIGILPFDTTTGAPVLTAPELVGLKTVDALPSYYTVYMYSGNFFYTGPLQIKFGYRVAGKTVLSSTPIDITILPVPK